MNDRDFEKQLRAADQELAAQIHADLDLDHELHRAKVRPVGTSFSLPPQAEAPSDVSVQPPRSVRPRQRFRPEYRSIMVIDMVGSGRWNNQEQLYTRSVLRAAVRTAVSRAGIRWTELAVEDRGDGMILLVPPKVSTVSLLDPVIPRLVEELDAHNATVAANSQIRLRVAVHVGQVHRDGQGWVGGDLVTACRLIDDVALRWRLRSQPRANLVLVVSDLIYESVVRHQYRDIDPSTYIPIRISAKEVSTQAWLHTPSSAPPRQTPRPAPEPRLSVSDAELRQRSEERP